MLLCLLVGMLSVYGHYYLTFGHDEHRLMICIMHVCNTIRSSLIIGVWSFCPVAAGTLWFKSDVSHFCSLDI